MARGKLWMLALAGAVALAACGDTNGISGVQVVDNSSSVAVSVSAGIAPTFTWSGGAARRLVVRNLETGLSVWEVEAVDAQVGFNGPITQAVVPAGGREVVAARLLETGRRFEVRITLRDGSETRREFQP